MNIIVFCLRIFFFTVAVGAGIGEFVKGNTVGGAAALIISGVVVWPVVHLLYLRQKPRPVKANAIPHISIQRGMAWLRFLFAYMYALTNTEKLTGYDPAKWVTILFSLFLLAPISRKLFTYRLPLPRAKFSTVDSMAYGLAFLRGYAILSIYVGLEPMETTDNPEYPYVFVSMGVVLLFSRQLGILLSGKKGEVPLWETVYAPAPSPAVLTATAFNDISIVPHAGAMPVAASMGLSEKILPAEAPVVPAINPLDELNAAYTQLLKQMPVVNANGFQQFLTNLFAQFQFDVAGAFQVQGAGVSGVFEMEHQVYILQATCQPSPCRLEDLLIFNGKVEAKSTWARGIYFSMTGFDQEGLEAFARGKRTSMICVDGHDLQLILQGRISLPDAIKRKARRAVETNHSFISLQKLL